MNLKEIAELIDAKLIGDPDFRITNIEELEHASQTDAAFLENSRYQKQAQQSQAGVIILQEALLPKNPVRNYLIHPFPSLAFQKLVEIFVPAMESGFEILHPSSVIHSTAKLDPSVRVAPQAVIDQHVTIGMGTQIGAGVSIGPGVTIGENCLIHPKAVIREECQIGSRVIIQPGAVIGSCGFGYFTNPKTGKHTPLAQRGIVVIEDDVEIGANTTIDRARFKETRIHKGTKIDNLVQIAHQVSLGEDNMIVSQVGVAGSTKTGRNVVMGGQVGVAGHISIADGTILTARCAVSKTLDKAGTYYGQPAMVDKEFKEHFLALKRVGRMTKRFKELEKRFSHLLEEDE